MSNIMINDIFNELNEENKRLLNELIFAKKCLKVLLNFKTFIDFISDKFKYNLDSNETKKLDQLNKDVEQVLVTKCLSFSQYQSSNQIKPNVGTQEPDVNINKTMEPMDTTNDQIMDSMAECSDDNNEEEYDMNGNDCDSDSTYVTDIHISDNDSDFEPKSCLSFKCDICGICCRTRIKLNAHKRTDHKNGNQPFICALDGCDYQTFKKINFDNHIKQHKGVQPFSCLHNGCNFSTYSKSSLKSHRETHSKRFKCILCNRKYAKEDNFERHSNECNKNALKCTAIGCDYKTIKKSLFEEHTNRHNGIKPFVCTFDSCEESFVARRDLVTHMRFKHRLVIQRYVCDFKDCLKKLKTETDLRLHKNRHSQNKEFPFFCNLLNCDHRFIDKCGLKAHMEHLHKTHPCPLDCGKFFDSKGRAELHSQSHSVKQEFVCDFVGCHKKFKTNTRLKTHYSIHLNKRVSCDWPECEFSTHSTSSLKRHQLVHTREHKLLCHWPSCAKPFSRQYDLNIHIKKCHLDIQPHVCVWPGCLFRSVTAFGLKKHMEKH